MLNATTFPCTEPSNCHHNFRSSTPAVRCVMPRPHRISAIFHRWTVQISIQRKAISNSRSCEIAVRPRLRPGDSSGLRLDDCFQKMTKTDFKTNHTSWPKENGSEISYLQGPAHQFLPPKSHLKKQTLRHVRRQKSTVDVPGHSVSHHLASGLWTSLHPLCEAAKGQTCPRCFRKWLAASTNVDHEQQSGAPNASNAGSKPKNPNAMDNASRPTTKKYSDLSELILCNQRGPATQPQPKPQKQTTHKTQKSPKAKTFKKTDPVLCESPPTCLIQGLQQLWARRWETAGNLPLADYDMSWSHGLFQRAHPHCMRLKPPRLQKQPVSFSAWVISFLNKSDHVWPSCFLDPQPSSLPDVFRRRSDFSRLCFYPFFHSFKFQTWLQRFESYYYFIPCQFNVVLN